MFAHVANLVKFPPNSLRDRSSTAQLPVSNGSSPESAFEERFRMLKVVDVIKLIGPEMGT